MNSNIGLSLIACLTLGLAPFTPEPHIIGKLRWLFGGAKGMQIMDYMDMLMHGLPWVALIYFVSKKLLSKKSKPTAK